MVWLADLWIDAPCCFRIFINRPFNSPTLLVEIRRGGLEGHGWECGRPARRIDRTRDACSTCCGRDARTPGSPGKHLKIGEVQIPVVLSAWAFMGQTLIH